MTTRGTAGSDGPDSPGPDHAKHASPEIDEFLTWLAVERGRTLNTVKAYRRDLLTYLEFLGSRVPNGGVVAATEDDVTAFIAHLRDVGRAPSTVARATVSVRSMYRYLAREGIAEADPSASLDVPRVPRGLPKALSEDEVMALLASPVGDGPLVLRDRAILETLYGAGLRVSELVGLSLRDVDVSAGVLRAFGKGRRERVVPLGRHSIAALGDWISGAGRQAVLHDRPISRDAAEAVFLNSRGGRLTRQGAWMIIKGHGDRAGIDSGSLSPHVLRHSCATHMLNHGADIRSVQELLGHVSISSTQRYTAVSQERLKAVYEAAHPRASGA